MEATIKVIKERKSHVFLLLILCIIMGWFLFLFLFRSVMLSLCLGNWWLVCFSTALSFRIFCHCLFVFTTLICLSSFDLTAHFLSLFVLTDAVEVAQTVWVVFALSGWQLPSWSVFAQLAVFFLGTSGSMELLFITRWDLHPSLSNQLNCNKDSIKCQIHQRMPHSSSVAKQNECILFFPGLFFLTFTHFEWEITPNGPSNENHGDHEQQIENNFRALKFVYSSEKKMDC